MFKSKSMKITVTAFVLAAIVVAIPFSLYAYATQKPWIHPFVSQEEYAKLPQEKKDQVDKDIRLQEDPLIG
jgi:hypothetical protein